MAGLPNPKSKDESVYNVYAMRYARNPTRIAADNFMRRLPDAHDALMPSAYYVWL